MEPGLFQREHAICDSHERNFDYQYANDLTWFGGPGAYLLLNEKYTLTLQLAISGEHKGTDTFRGTKAEDTGVTTVYLGPQIGMAGKRI